MKLKQLYWIVNNPKPKHNQLFVALQTKHVTTKQVHSFEELYLRFNQNRSSVVIIGDELGITQLAKYIKDIVTKPEFNGVRFILSLSSPKPKLAKAAMALGFRDIISLDLPIDKWLMRFEFSASSKEISYLEPTPQMTLQTISAVTTPARITWIGDSLLRLESKIDMPVGAKARISGRISEDLGLRNISIRVKEPYSTNLVYRYSQAYLCEWEIPRGAIRKKELLLENLQRVSQVPPLKIFAAIKAQDMRQTLITSFNDPYFDLIIALQKSSLVDESRFFEPNVVLIDRRIFTGGNEVYLRDMLRALDSKTPVFIIGAEKSEQALFEGLTRPEQRKSIITFPRLPSNFPSLLKRKMERSKKDSNHETGSYLIRGHHYSFAEIRMPARMTKIHAEGAELLIPYKLGRFGLCAIDSSIFTHTIGRRVTAKIASSYHHENPNFKSFPYKIHLSLSDVMENERQSIAEYLVQIFTSQLLGRPSATLFQQTNSQGLSKLKKTYSDDLDTQVEIKSEKTEDRQSNRNFTKYRKEIAMIMGIFAIIILFLSLIYLVRSPEKQQGKVFSDSFKKFRENYDNEND